MTAGWDPVHLTPFVLMVLAALGIGLVALAYRLQPVFLLPLAAGLLLANLPSPGAAQALQPFWHTIQSGLDSGLYPALIMLGWGAGANLNYLIAHPRQIFLGFLTPLAFLAVLWLGQAWGLNPPQAGSIALIGGGDGLSSLFLAGQVARQLSGPIGLAAFILVGLELRLLPYLVRLLTTRQERILRMAATRKVSRQESLVFAVAGLILTLVFVPRAALLTGMFFLGCLVKESGIAERLTRTLANRLGEIMLFLLGLAAGSRCTAAQMLSPASVKILLLGLAALILANVVVILAIRVINLFVREKINPLVGVAALGYVPNSAHLANILCRREDPRGNLYFHALASSQAALVTSSLTAGVLWSILGGG